MDVFGGDVFWANVLGKGEGKDVTTRPSEKEKKIEKGDRGKNVHSYLFEKNLNPIHVDTVVFFPSYPQPHAFVHLMAPIHSQAQTKRKRQ